MFFFRGRMLSAVLDRSVSDPSTYSYWMHHKRNLKIEFDAIKNILSSPHSSLQCFSVHGDNKFFYSFLDKVMVMRSSIRRVTYQLHLWLFRTYFNLSAFKLWCHWWAKWSHLLLILSSVKSFVSVGPARVAVIKPSLSGFTYPYFT